MFTRSVLPVSIAHISVVIPVREGDSIASCLDSVSNASSAIDVDVSVTLVGDGCLVGTLDRVSGMRGVRIVEPGIPSRRTPRAVGASFALAHAEVPKSQTWVANTEGNVIVPENWLVDQVTLANGGADVVIGAVEGLPFGRPSGANLGIRASSYLGVGGYRAPVQGADSDLVARAALKNNVVFDRGNMVIDTHAPWQACGFSPTFIHVLPVQLRERRSGFVSL